MNKYYLVDITNLCTMRSITRVMLNADKPFMVKGCSSQYFFKGLDIANDARSVDEYFGTYTTIHGKLDMRTKDAKNMVLDYGYASINDYLEIAS